MTKGKIVLLPFPFDDLASHKVRPALCLTDPLGIHRHIVLAFISSQVPSDLNATDLLFDPAQPDFRATGLRVPSVLRLHRLATLTTALMRRQLGQISASRQKEVDQKLAILFGLRNP